MNKIERFGRSESRENASAISIIVTNPEPSSSAPLKIESARGHQAVGGTLVARMYRHLS
jgi:hypothetical protein